MRKFLNKLKTENTLARLKSALQKQYDIDSCIKNFFNEIIKNTKNVCAKLNVVLYKEYDFDSYVKKSGKAFIKNTKIAFFKLNVILHKEIDLDYYVIKSLKAIRENAKRIYPKLKTALKKEYDIDSYVKKALSSFVVFLVRCYRLFNLPTRYLIRAAAVISIKTHKIFIGLSKFVVLKGIILRDAIKQRRNKKIKARLDQERENIAFLTEFLNSLKEEFGADISFSLVSVNNDEGSFEVINEH